MLEWGLLLHLGLRRLPLPWRLYGAGYLRQTGLPLPGLWPYPQPAAICHQGIFHTWVFSQWARLKIGIFGMKLEKVFNCSKEAEYILAINLQITE